MTVLGPLGRCCEMWGHDSLVQFCFVSHLSFWCKTNFPLMFTNFSSRLVLHSLDLYSSSIQEPTRFPQFQLQSLHFEKKTCPQKHEAPPSAKRRPKWSNGGGGGRKVRRKRGRGKSRRRPEAWWKQGFHHLQRWWQFPLVGHSPYLLGVTLLTICLHHLLWP